MPCFVVQRNPFDTAVNPITEAELATVAKALNETHKTCCVKGCERERMGWVADGPSLRGIGFCSVHWFHQLEVIT